MIVLLINSLRIYFHHNIWLSEIKDETFMTDFSIINLPSS